MDVIFDTKKFGLAVSRKRIAEKKTLREMGELLRISAATIHRVEKLEMPNVHTLCCLCSWLKVPPNRFFEVLK